MTDVGAAQVVPFLPATVAISKVLAADVKEAVAYDVASVSEAFSMSRAGEIAIYFTFLFEVYVFIIT